MEESCDYHEYSFAFQFRDPQPIVGLVQRMAAGGRLMMPPAQQEGMLFAMILELTTAAVITVGRPAADVGRLAAYLLIAGPLFRMWGPNKEAVGRDARGGPLRLEPAHRRGAGDPGPIQFHDVVDGGAGLPHEPARPQRPRQGGRARPALLRGNVDSAAAPLAGRQHADRRGRPRQPAEEAARRGAVHPGLRRRQPDRRLRFRPAASQARLDRGRLPAATQPDAPARARWGRT